MPNRDRAKFGQKKSGDKRENGFFSTDGRPSFAGFCGKAVCLKNAVEWPPGLRVQKRVEQSFSYTRSGNGGGEVNKSSKNFRAFRGANLGVSVTLGW